MVVRAALIPRLKDSTDLDAERFSTPADGLGGLTTATEASLTVHSLKPSHLDKIQKLLLRGERRQAYHYALNEKLWAHAMVIASSIDKESWQEVANEFIRTELDSKIVKDVKDRNSELGRGGPGSANGSGGFESLRVVYSLYAGQGAAAG
jgi:COPII coat assembly protein SEC16